MSETDTFIDGSLYPDQPVPESFANDEERADYVHRVCGAFDFGMYPELETLKLFAHWKEVFDRYPIDSSRAYHTFRAYFGWEEREMFPALDEPLYRKLDRLEGRTDPCEDMI